RGVGADPECERNDGDGGEPGIVLEDPERVSDVLRGAFEPALPPHVARGFLNLRQIAELAPRGRVGVARRLSTGDAIGGGHLKMRPEFFPEFVVAVSHDSLVSGFERTPAIASTSFCQRDRSEASWRRPAAVSR